MHYNFTNQLNGQNVFKPTSYNILTDIGVDQIFNSDPSPENAEYIILSAINFEYLNILKSIEKGGINDASITTDPSQRIMPELTNQLEAVLANKFKPRKLFK